MQPLSKGLAKSSLPLKKNKQTWLEPGHQHQTFPSGSDNMSPAIS